MLKISHADKQLELHSPVVMGILNTTPDSFSDGGRYVDLDVALARAQQMIDLGVAIIDIGGESTRPGAPDVALEEELQRVIPLIKAIRKQNAEVWISIDTSKAEVMRQALAAGADLMQANPHYYNIIEEVCQFLAERIAQCEAAGIKRENIILDPGFGFGKSVQHNYHLLAHLEQFHRFGLPVLAGMSRKSMIFKTLNKQPAECVAGSVACATLAAQKGAQIIRVHDVEQTIDALKMVQMMHNNL